MLVLPSLVDRSTCRSSPGVDAFFLAFGTFEKLNLLVVVSFELSSLFQYDLKMLRLGEHSGLPVGLGNGDTSKLADVLMVAAVEIESMEPSRDSLGRRSPVEEDTTADTRCAVVTLAQLGKGIAMLSSPVLSPGGLFLLAFIGLDDRGRDPRGFSLVTVEMSRMSRAWDRTSLVLSTLLLSPSSGVISAPSATTATTISPPPSMVRIYALSSFHEARKNGGTANPGLKPSVGSRCFRADGGAYKPVSE